MNHSSSFRGWRISAILLALVYVLFAATSFGAELLRVSTLNGYFLFKPGYDPQGRLRHKGPQDMKTYQTKVDNLARLVEGAHVVALQEVGSEVEVHDLARRLNGKSVFVQGRDTYTGQDVGFVHSLPSGFRAVHAKRVPMLDRALSKHLLLVIDGPTVRYNLLNVHLTREITDPDKNTFQRQMIEQWVAEVRKAEPDSIVVVMGDMNVDQRGPVLSSGVDALESLNWAYTHCDRLRLDRMIIFGKARWVATEVIRPPYGPRPNDINRLLWTDHFPLIGGVVTD